MKKLLQVGITGGIGSGKSIVCKIFRTLGASVYDADSRAKDLMTSDEDLIRQIKSEFGANAYLDNGSLNRDYLGKIVFGSVSEVAKLNHLVHPKVAIDYKRWTELHRDEIYVIKEAALLFESSSYKELDKIVLVSAPQELKIKRVLQRDPQRTTADILNIMQNQMPEEEKIKKTEYRIINDESRLVIPQVLALHLMFLNGRLSDKF